MYCVSCPIVAKHPSTPLYWLAGYMNVDKDPAGLWTTSVEFWSGGEREWSPIQQQEQQGKEKKNTYTGIHTHTHQKVVCVIFLALSLCGLFPFCFFVFWYEGWCICFFLLFGFPLFFFLSHTK
ncbi:hypothetical protein ABW19_dt0204794 [Dactylella cylindrospora]|nr:hypothetical protein ABW19_dt0204794 [Dactylella cylindrospora]